MVTEYVPVDKNNPLRGVQAVQKVITVPENPEVINLETGQSNSKYWKSDVVLNPEGCKHHFVLIDAGKREVECTKCSLPTNFNVIPGLFRETKKHKFFIFHKKEYEIFES